MKLNWRWIYCIFIFIYCGQWYDFIFSCYSIVVILIQKKMYQCLASDQYTFSHFQQKACAVISKLCLNHSDCHWNKMKSTCEKYFIFLFTYIQPFSPYLQVRSDRGNVSVQCSVLHIKQMCCLGVSLWHFLQPTYLHCYNCISQRPLIVLFNLPFPSPIINKNGISQWSNFIYHHHGPI